MGGIMKNYNWDLGPLYYSIDKWEIEFQEIVLLLDELTNKKESFTKSGLNLFNFLEKQTRLEILLSKFYIYAKLSLDTNLKDQKNKKNFEKADDLSFRVQDVLSFIEPELLKIPQEEYKSFLKVVPQLGKYNFMFKKLFQKKEHILDAETEQLLSGMDSVSSFFEKAYDDLTIADLEYPLVKEPESRKEISANNTNYYLAMLNSDRDFRKNFFTSLLGTYQKYSNTITSLYFGSVKKNVLEAKKRNYKSALKMALESNFIDEKIYHNLINTVRDNTHVLQDYLDYRKNMLNYKELHFYDLFVPLTENINKEYTFEEAEEIIFKALKPLGEDYLKVLKRAFDERWMDVYPQENKTSGAYAIGVYDVHPYSLLNFNGTLNDIFTIAHELGHVMHSYYSNKEQEYVNSNYSIFCAEVASTVNEQLLYHYLLNNSQSKEMKKYLLNDHLDSLRSTFFRQCLFAEFEKNAHELVENNQPLTESILSEMYKSLYENYYGKNFVIDKELEYEWARIPHFYSAFYVYQYATGISAAIAISDKIMNDEKYDINNYLNFLKSGDSNYSVELLKLAKVDMSSPKPINATINNFKETLKKLKNI